MTTTLDAHEVSSAPRAGFTSWGRPLAVAAGASGVLTYLALVDPNQSGHYPLCPLHALTGLDCPGCGALRGLHDLAHGNVAGALDHNLMLAFFVPYLVFRWAMWAWRSVDQRRAPLRTLMHPNYIWGICAVVLVFTVLRNIPGVGFLGSGIG